MNYEGIKTLALGYADREDQEVIARIDDFITIVEARVNRVLEVRKMTARSQVPTVVDQVYYGLPGDFSGIRDIEITNIDGSGRETLSMVTPEQMTQQEAANITGAQTQIVYAIVADQLQIYPPQTDRILEIVYYQNLPNLNSVDNENWLSFYAGDVYVFGLLVEINSFIKDAQTAQLWDGRFKEELDALDADDQRTRWSGPPMRVRNT